ncbi:MAG: acyl-CoA dehydrogenase [Streptosporangiales bacterium]|nr:acyl-CoA dehydrogenase [Streptosporangiales bacterium]
MDFTIPEELEAMRDAARKFTDRELIPLEPQVIAGEMERGMDTEPFEGKPGEHYTNDPDGVIPYETYQYLVATARKMGLWGLDVPEELGGQDISVLGKMMVHEETFHSLVPFTLPPDSPNLHWMMAVCTPEQRDRYLEPYARGEISACIAVTEPNAGADASGIQTSAVKKGTKWILNGRKMWINRADWSSFMIVLAKTDKELGSKGGITAFLVDRHHPGVTVQRRIATIVAERPCEITFDDVELDDGAVLGTVGWAFPELQNRFSVRRLEIGMRCLGASERLLQMMVDQANTKSTFGAPLASRQSIQWWIADATTDIHAVRMMAYNAAWKLDQGVRDIRYEASMIKVKATELVARVADQALQVHGGLGVAKELPIEFFYRLCRVWRIVEGPSEVHRMVIARNRLKNRKPSAS